MYVVRDGGEGYAFNPLQPPSPEELKRQWKFQYENREIEYQRKADRNRKQAIKEILQEQVRHAVKPDERLEKIFRESIGQ